MAEVVGVIASGLTLAGLFKVCLEAFDLIQTSRKQEIDLKKLKLRLNIEKCRLYIWGESMGLTDTVEAARERLIDNFRFPDIVKEILENLFELFDNSHKIQDKYGCRQATSEDLLLEMDQSGPLRSLAASFSNFSVRSSNISRGAKLAQKVTWVIHNRKKFSVLVSDIKYLVDSLQGITNSCVPLNQQAGTMRRKIVNISDAETLSMIAEVCSEDHPDIADAASTKADTISLASTHQRYVAAWTEDVQVDNMEGERLSPDIESMTVTELKRELLELRKNRREQETNFASMAEFRVAELQSEQLGNPISASAHTPNDANRITPVKSQGTNISAVTANGTSENISGSLSAIGLTHRYPIPQFTSPWANYPTSTEVSHTLTSTQLVVSSTPRNNSSDIGSFHNHDTSRFIINPYSRQNTSTMSFDSTSSVHDNSIYDGSASRSVEDFTDRSSITSEIFSESIESRTFPRSALLTSMASAPQSMKDQFSSKVSSSSQKRHKCKVCDKRFTRPSSLQTHMYSHTGEKPFTCNVEGCGRQFSVPSNLRRHMKKHNLTISATIELDKMEE